MSDQDVFQSQPREYNQVFLGTSDLEHSYHTQDSHPVRWGCSSSQHLVTLFHIWAPRLDHGQLLMILVFIDVLKSTMCTKSLCLLLCYFLEARSALWDK